MLIKKSSKSVITLYFLVSFYLSDAMPLGAKASWNFFVYMEASAGSLYQAAFKNINELMINAPEQAHVFIFLHTQGNKGWLYHVEKNNLHTVEDIILDDSVSANIITVMKKVVSYGPADHQALILWDHGYGILDPLFNEQTGEWEIELDGDYAVACSIKKSAMQHGLHRGMCVTENKTFLSNTEMTHTFETISTDLLDGKKIALCGMDLCKGAMLEHAYQLRNSVEYLIGSQECEMVDGWPYDVVLQILNEEPTVTPLQFAQHIVSAYQEYYRQNSLANMYTISALDLSYADAIKKNIDDITSLLLQGMDRYDFLKTVLTKIRKECNGFCDAPMYCDLYQWYQLCMDAIGDYPVTHNSIRLQELLRQGMHLISTLVVAQCAGSVSEHAHGASIYFPLYKVNNSYPSTPFAQESVWLTFLQKYLA